MTTQIVQWKNNTKLFVFELPEDEWDAQEDVKEAALKDGFSLDDLYYLWGTVKQLNDDNLEDWGFNFYEVALYQGYIFEGGTENTSYGKKNKRQLEQQGIISEQKREAGLFVTGVPGFSDILHILPVEDDKLLLTCYQEGIEEWSFQGKLEMVADKISAWYTNEYVIPVVGKNHLKFAKPGDAGVDLKAENECDVYPKGWQGESSEGLSDFELQAKRNNVTIVHTGLHMAIPTGYMGIVVPRSGIALKHGIQVMNTPGIIDSGYRGEIMIGLVNHGNEVFHINKDDRIAQLIIVPFQAPVFLSVDTLGETERGDGGFGSTGIK